MSKECIGEWRKKTLMGSDGRERQKRSSDKATNEPGRQCSRAACTLALASGASGLGFECPGGPLSEDFALTVMHAAYPQA
eukprot:1141042-Pelagomonas_calceolata.AAC.12